MKIKGYRFPCKVCGENKIVSSTQVFFRKNGEVSYARARHYGADKKVYYHQQSLEYTNRKLGELANIDPSQAFNSKSIGHPEVEVRIESKSRLELVGLPGFEPESIEPKSTSLDQASREPRRFAENIISTEP
jgi:hypothetical protein